MAAQTIRYAFNRKSPRDLLEKARRELARMEQAPAYDDVEQTDHALTNLAITLWHITDWLANGAGDVLRAHGYPAKYEGLSKRVIDDSRPLNICYQLAIGAKHLVPERSFQGPRVTATDVKFQTE